MCRIYDKRKEQGIEGPEWWRVEMQNRYKPQVREYLPPDMFDIVTIFHEPKKDIGLNLQQKAMLEYLIKHPEAKQQLDRKTALKYEEIMKAPGVRLSNPPEYVYKKLRKKLDKDLYTILRGVVVDNSWREVWGDVIKDIPESFEHPLNESVDLLGSGVRPVGIGPEEQRTDMYRPMPKVKRRKSKKGKIKARLFKVVRVLH